MKIKRTKDLPKYILKAHNTEKRQIKTYSANTKTDCMYKFDRYNLRRGFTFFMLEIDNNIFRIKLLPRDYPYQEHKLE